MSNMNLYSRGDKVFVRHALRVLFKLCLNLGRALVQRVVQQRPPAAAAALSGEEKTRQFLGRGGGWMGGGRGRRRGRRGRGRRFFPRGGGFGGAGSIICIMFAVAIVVVEHEFAHGFSCHRGQST